MKRISLILIGFVITTTILCSVQPAVRADGIPMTLIELHGTLRENRQLAYVSVDRDGRSETLDLFLNVVSLEPGNNISIMIPLRTRPYTIHGEEMSESQFRNERNFNNIEKLADKQNHALGEVIDRTAETTADLVKWQMLGIFGVMVVGMGGGSSDGEHYEIADGVSMDMVSFNSTDSLREFYASHSLGMPDSVEEIIDRYGDFNVGVINAVTRPPIDETKFDQIANQCPVQLAEFRSFVAANPTITTYGYHDSYYYGMGWNNAELDRIINSIANPQMRWEFSQLIAATYGQSAVSGTLISFYLPLYDKTAFFPLGTTPAWNGVSKTEVIFRVDGGQVLDFDRGGDEVFHEGSHYYVWNFGARSPDYDLEGKVKSAGLMTGLNRFSRQTEEWVYEKSSPLGSVLGIILLISIWSAGLWAVSWMRKWVKGGKRKFLKILALGTICFFTSNLLTVMFGLFIAFSGLVLLESRYLPNVGREGRYIRPKHVLSVLLGILLMITGFLCFSGMYLGRNSMIAIPLGISLLGVIFIFLYCIFSNNSSMERRIGAWFLYLAMMTPSFLLVSSVTSSMAYCTIAFFMFMLIQTGIYLQLVKIEENEAEYKLVICWSEASSTDYWQPKKA